MSSIHLNRWSQVETRLSACLPVIPSNAPSPRLVPMLVARPQHPQRAPPAGSSRRGRLALQSYLLRAPARTRPDMVLNRGHNALPQDFPNAGSRNLKHSLVREIVTRRCRSSRLWWQSTVFVASSLRRFVAYRRDSITTNHFIELISERPSSQGVLLYRQRTNCDDQSVNLLCPYRER